MLKIQVGNQLSEFRNVRGLKFSEQDRGELSKARLDQILQGLVGQGQGQGKKSGIHPGVRESN